MTTRRIKRWKMVLIVVAALALWTFIVCFPNPYIAFRNGVRYLNLPVDPSVIEIVEDGVPDEPEDIERFVKNLVRYQYDWKNYGMPDYVATARQSVTRRKGDCEDRAIVLASLLEAKNIEYNLKASPVHYWVEYPGKRKSRSENEEVSFFGKEDGKYKIKLPDSGHWRHYFDAGKKGFWDAMPGYRKILMVSGWLLTIFLGFFLNRKKAEEQPTDTEGEIINGQF